MKRSQTPIARKRRPCRECPVPGCKQRFISAGAAGTHLDVHHDEAGRWDSGRYHQVKDADGVAIFDETNTEAYVSSTLAVEVRRE